MKFKYILIATLSVTLWSCQDDFLNPDSLSTFDNDFIYSNVDDARRGVNAIYSHFNQDAFRSRLSNNMTGNTDIERQSGWTSTGDRYQIWDLEALSSNRDLDIVWTYAYQAIRDANIAIDGINASGNLDATDPSIRRTFRHLLGEAHTLRANWYSMLIFYFGDVPYSISAPVAGSDFNLPKTNRLEILTSEIDAMRSVEEDMQWAESLPFGIEQVSREFTLGMIARMALQRGGYYLTPGLTQERASDYLEYYQIAKDYSQKLVDLKDRPLPTDFRQVFLNQSKFISPVNSDVLFEIPFPIGGGDVGWNIGITVRGGATAIHDYGSGNNYMGIPPTYYLSFDSTDMRRDVTCALYQVNEQFEEEFIPTAYNIAQGKWSRHFLDNPPGKNSAKGTGINWPMMRYADVLLMLAEAENELNGPTGIAQEAIRRVRQRAFDQADWGPKVDQYIASASASKDSFFDAIVDERGWEFGGEMIRKYELIRWGNYSEKVEETREGLKDLADAADAYINSGSPTDLPVYIFWKRDDSGNFIMLNPDSFIADAPDDTWQRANFLGSLTSTTSGTGYQEWITRDYENYINGPAPGIVRYIFPLPVIAIENSSGPLQNDGYGF